MIAVHAIHFAKRSLFDFYLSRSNEVKRGADFREGSIVHNISCVNSTKFETQRQIEI